MKVTPVSKTSSDLLKESFLRIPRFQRPYDWNNENLTDFWNDLISRAALDYFMGSLVLYQDGKENNVLYLVDGQQRTTTTVITLAVLRDELSGLGDDNLAQGVQNYLQTKYIKAKVKGADLAKEEWSAIVTLFDSVKTPYEVDDFLLHYWLSKETYVSKAKLFKEFKAKTPQKEAKSRLEDLKDAAAAYISTVAPREAEWTKQEYEIRNSLSAISTFRVAQAIPLVL